MAFDILTVVSVCLALSFILSELFFRIKYPRVIGQILAGVILGLPLIRAIFTPEVLTDISFLSDLGIIFLLLLTGLQLNLSKFKEAERETILLALSTVVVSFLLGFAFTKAVGYNTVTAFIVGACFSLTAEGTTLKVLIDMKALNTKVGVIILGAGILDDVFEVLFLSAVLIIAQRDYGALAILPAKFLLFIAAVYVTFKLFPRILRLIQREHSRIATFTFIILFGLSVSLISKKLELGPILGAFIAGVIIHLSEKNKVEYADMVKELEALTFAFIIPFFFINIGLNFSYESFFNNFWFSVMIIFLATAGKLLGATLMTPFTGLTLRQTHAIGWALNSRGAVELVIAEVARAKGLLPIELYSGIVVMAVFTTLIFPVMLKRIIAQDRTVLG